MSLHPNFHGPGTSLSGRIQIGHKSGLFIIYYLFIYYLFSVNIKPPRHRFGFSLAWVWQNEVADSCPFCNHHFIPRVGPHTHTDTHMHDAAVSYT